MAETAIQWTDVVDNIIVVKGGGWWCRKVSDGCTNCYAAKLNQSDYFHGNKLPYSGEPPELILKSDIIKSWTRQRVSKKHFVSSMTDVFGEWVKREWQFEMLDGMRAAPKQTFQVLTKRADVMLEAVTEWLKWNELDILPSNIWPMVTTENQEQADKRIPYLLSVPAHIRGISAEPLLGPLVLDGGPHRRLEPPKRPRYLISPRLRRRSLQIGAAFYLGDLVGIDWVIVGGESGTKARQCDISNIRSLVEQCRAADVACFVKQLGSKPFMSVKGFGPDIKDKKGGEISEFPEDLRVRQFPHA